MGDNKRRKDARAKEMYDEYKKGFSCSDVAKMFDITRQSVFATFKVRKLQLRKKKQLPFLSFKNIKFTPQSNGYYRKTDGKRELMHRFVWEYYNGKIPKGYDIHHKDEDITHNNINNFEMIKKDEILPTINGRVS
jgi:hypothetical protein